MEQRVRQLPGEALQRPALPAPGIHGGRATRRCIYAAVNQPRFAATVGGARDGRHGWTARRGGGSRRLTGRREGGRKIDGIPGPPRSSARCLKTRSDWNSSLEVRNGLCWHLSGSQPQGGRGLLRTCQLPSQPGKCTPVDRGILKTALLKKIG